MQIRRAVIPVAGFGTRMLPFTKAIPKEMVTIIDKPAIQYAVEEAVESGIQEIVFVTSKNKVIIEDHFDRYFELEEALEKSGKHEQLNTIMELCNKCEIVSVRQQEQLGLGHAVYCARNIVGDEPFAVILPDDLFLYKKPVIGQLIEKYESVKAPVLALQKVKTEETSKYGIVSIDRKLENNFFKLKEMVEKPETDPPSDLAIVGRYILDKNIMRALENTTHGALGEIQLTDAINFASSQKDVYGLLYEGKRFDCGSKMGYLEAVVNFAGNREDTRQGFMKIIKDFINNNE